MSINPEQLKNDIIIPTLKYLGMHSTEAVNLLMGTAATESHLGHYIKQVDGPALGIYQMEPATHDDIVKNYIEYREPLMQTIAEIGYKETNSDLLLYDMRYATIFCRIHYLRQSGKLPYTVRGMAKYWKNTYNTHLGKGREIDFLNKYNRYVGEI